MCLFVLLVQYKRGGEATRDFNTFLACIYNNTYLLTAIGLSPGGSGYFTCIQNMKFVTNKFKSGGLH